MQALVPTQVEKYPFYDLPSNSVDWATAVVGETNKELTCFTPSSTTVVAQSKKSPGRSKNLRKFDVVWIN